MANVVKIEDIRDLQDLTNTNDIFSCLKMVEINPTELCNRTCVFCPRSDNSIYKNKNLHISFETVERIGKQLSEINYTGRIGFVGFGEPLLHNNIIQCVSIIKQTCPTAQWIELNTNGDRLTKEIIKDLYKVGCSTIAVSMYDNDNTDKLHDIAKGIDIDIAPRHHYDPKQNYNLNIVNRKGILKEDTIENNNRYCYIPFYKLFIDYNGDYLICDQDWGRSSKKYNIFDVSIKDFWQNKINDIRSHLNSGNRNYCFPCKGCDVNGVLRGKKSFDFITGRK